MQLKELINKLEKIGFTTYESKVFLVLYQGYRMSASEIAKEAKIPRPSVYEILRNFAKKGICNEIETPSKQIYEVIDSIVLEDKIKDGIEYEHKTKLANLETCFRELKPLYKSKQPPEYKTDVELVRGFNRLRDLKFLELIKSSSKGILFMNRFKGNVSADLDDESKKFFKRGGYVKSIYEISTDFKIKVNNKWQNVSKADLIKLCEEFAKHGEQIRFLDEVPQIMGVFDEKIVFISLFDETIPASEMSDIIIKNKRFATFITGLFNLYWDKANALEELSKQIFNKN
jgi:sugar-specific transcriptional regulator TrmB